MSQFSMIDVNRVFLAGRLTQDPELRYTSSGVAVTTLRLAINRRYTTREGDKKEDVCYVNAVVWDKQAENCAEYLTKGRPVHVEGSLQSRSWEAQDGTKRTTLEVRAQRVQFMDWVAEGEAAPEEAADTTPPADDDIPF